MIKMIKKTQQPEAWPVPHWHSDFGDARVELEHLRSLALALSAIMPRASIELETTEPGLMNLAVELPDGTAVEVYSLPAQDKPDRRRFGLFFAPGETEESEVYAESIEGALNHLTDWTRGEAGSPNPFRAP